MSNTKNIFEFLSDDESGDDNKQNQNKEKRVRVNKNQKKPQQTSSQANSKVDNNIADRSTRKQVDSRDKRDYNNKGDNNRPRRRSQDRHTSGSGINQNQQKNFRKDGGGRGNIGTVKDEVQGREVREEQSAEEEEEEEEDNNITLEQYYQSKGKNLEDVIDSEQVAEKKEKKIDQEFLKKDKLSIVQKKPELAPKTTKKAKQQGDYKPNMSGECNNLLNVRTGFVAEKKQAKRAPRQEGEQQEKQEGGEQQQQASSEVQQKEGEDQQQNVQEGENKRRNNNNRGGDNRGDNRGPRRDNNNRDNRGGDRDNRGPRRDNNNNRDNRGGDRDNRAPKNNGGNKQSKGKGFVESNDDFPTLG